MARGARSYGEMANLPAALRERIERFRAILAEHRLTATVRLARGRDIDAACGQLAHGPRR